MFRVIRMSSKTYAINIDDIEDDIDNIREFVESGDVIILCNELEDLENYGFDKDDIKDIEVVK